MTQPEIYKNSRGRFVTTKIPQAKITPSIVRFIRAAYTEGNMTQKQLGKMWAISDVQVHRIVSRKSWGHVE